MVWDRNKRNRKWSGTEITDALLRFLFAVRKTIVFVILLKQNQQNSCCPPNPNQPKKKKKKRKKKREPTTTWRNSCLCCQGDTDDVEVCYSYTGMDCRLWRTVEQLPDEVGKTSPRMPRHIRDFHAGFARKFKSISVPDRRK